MVISKCQQLSDDFIWNYGKYYVYLPFIARYQTVSKRFLAGFRYNLNNNSDKPVSYWKERVQGAGLYECHRHYFYAYKNIRSDKYSLYDFRYQYLLGETYECFSDYSDDEDSFGFYADSASEAEKYSRGLTIRVKIYYKDVTAVVHDGGKIRCKKLIVMN